MSKKVKQSVTVLYPE